MRKRETLGCKSQIGLEMERMTGVEPAFKAWEAFVLPMNYIRNISGGHFVREIV